MVIRGCILVFVLVLAGIHGVLLVNGELGRGSFPKGFVFGTASSSYQYEGAVNMDGRGKTIWDTFAHSYGKIIDFSNADVAVDQYHRFMDDIQLMKELGMDAYRLSIAWSRIFPNGTGEVNQAGIAYYNNLINTLLSNGIQPYVTLYHWDLPQALEDKYKGWLNLQIVSDFAIFAETCFKTFGDRIKNWITFNEPHTFAIHGYDVGLHAPGRCSILLNPFCQEGNSGTEPYIVGHHVLKSHAIVADIYRRKYKAVQHGSLGITLNVIWSEPLSNFTDDIDAAQRAQDFQFGWFMDPLFFGDYPSSMRKRVGDRLPKFSVAEAALVKGSLDFVGINHYTTYYVRNNWTNIIGLLPNDALADSGAVTLRKYTFAQFFVLFKSVVIFHIIPNSPKGVSFIIDNGRGICLFSSFNVFVVEPLVNMFSQLFSASKNGQAIGDKVDLLEQICSNLLNLLSEINCWLQKLKYHI